MPEKDTGDRDGPGPAAIVEVEVLSTELLGAGGFVELRRMQVRNLRQDGSRSRPYTLDAVLRPAGADAVVVVAYELDRPARSGARVLLRRGLRPVARLGRGGQPTREGTTPPVEVIEAVAGILEVGDVGEAGLRRRAALELEEEAGLRVEAGAIHPLGEPLFISIGIMAERLYFCAVETALRGHGPGAGDGSLLEEGGGGVSFALEEALRLCRAGAIADAKTELILRRLADHLTEASR